MEWIASVSQLMRFRETLLKEYGETPKNITIKSDGLFVEMDKYANTYGVKPGFDIRKCNRVIMYGIQVERETKVKE